MRICWHRSSSKPSSILDEFGAKIARSSHSLPSCWRPSGKQKRSPLISGRCSLLLFILFIWCHCTLAGHAVSQRMGKSFEVASSVNNSLFISLLSSLLSPEASHIQSLQLVGIDDWLGRGGEGRRRRCSYPAGLETNFSFLSATFEKTKKEKRNGRRREERRKANRV